MRVFKIGIVFPIGLALAGCLAPAGYQRPEVPSGLGWPTQNDSGGGKEYPAATDRWWTAFGDPGLDALVPAVLAANNDVVAASLRARRAMLNAGLSAEAGAPKLSGGAGGTRRMPFDGSGPGGQSVQSNLALSYELDLWGKMAAIRDIGDLEASASADDLEAARLAVAAATVSTWWQLAHANQMLDSANSGLAVTLRTRDIVETMRAAGTASDLEHFEMTQALEAQRASQEQLKRDRDVLRNRLVGLLNGKASPVAEPKRLPQGKLPELAPGLPVSLIGRRPDLRAAETRLRAALRRTDEKRASFYPPISLTGNLGAGGKELAELVANPIATLGANAVLPFLNMREMGLQIRVSDVQYEEAVSSFRGTMLTALTEVSDGLSSRAYLARQHQHLTRALDARKRAEALYETRFRAGAIALRPLLDAQEGTRLAKDSLLNNQLARLLNEATLIRALGGPPPPQAPP